MKFEDILTLAKAGYTPEVVQELMKEPKQTEPVNKQQEKQDPTPVKADTVDVSGLVAAVNSLKETIQASNFAGASHGGTKSLEEQVDEVFSRAFSNPKGGDK